MAPFIEQHAIPIAVLSASILGSGHCIAMCGGLVTSVASNRKDLVRYHLGRLTGYCGLGAFAGLLGKAVFDSSIFASLSWFFAAAMAFGFIYLGGQIWMGKQPHLFRLPRGIWSRLSGLGPGLTGLLSAFLPCGWLHTFVLGAVATRSLTLGAFYLFCFWLGTLPAVSVAPFAVSKIFQPLKKRSPKLSAILLIMIGVGCIGLKFLPGEVSGMGACHHDSE